MKLSIDIPRPCRTAHRLASRRSRLRMGRVTRMSR